MDFNNKNNTISESLMKIAKENQIQISDGNYQDKIKNKDVINKKYENEIKSLKYKLSDLENIKSFYEEENEKLKNKMVELYNDKSEYKKEKE